MGPRRKRRHFFGVGGSGLDVNCQLGIRKDNTVLMAARCVLMNERHLESYLMSPVSGVFAMKYAYLVGGGPGHGGTLTVGSISTV